MSELIHQAPEFIVVEGPIGVGKTSLVNRLADSLACPSLLEQAEQNPFLERFYQDPRAAAFPAQLHFLFQRSRQLQQLKQRDLFASRLVADFMFDKDRLFAETNLAREELALYDEVYARLAMDAPRPDLIVYLQAPVEVLMQRVRRRDRAVEKTLSGDYLARLCDAYARFFYFYDQAPVLIVNAGEINPVEREADYQALLGEICRPQHGRRYFNPSPLAIN
ncbi:MAG: deoxynucleoside kinase [Chromatiaceae bacterium]|nr:deoxynucleoside kinase [Chromatiaceae bacterium]